MFKFTALVTRANVFRQQTKLLEQQMCTCPTAIMPFRGVRISWLIRARNWLLASVAAAACTKHASYPRLQTQYVCIVGGVHVLHKVDE